MLLDSEGTSEFEPSWYLKSGVSKTSVYVYGEKLRFGEDRFFNSAFFFFIEDDVVRSKSEIRYWLDGMLAPERGF